MGQMGDTWRGVETSAKTGETDQGMTPSVRKQIGPGYPLGFCLCLALFFFFSS
jgi:hypothetical protein